MKKAPSRNWFLGQGVAFSILLMMLADGYDISMALSTAFVIVLLVDIREYISSDN